MSRGLWSAQGEQIQRQIDEANQAIASLRAEVAALQMRFSQFAFGLKPGDLDELRRQWPAYTPERNLHIITDPAELSASVHDGHVDDDDSDFLGKNPFNDDPYTW
jgi:hypothetical protein